MAYYVISDIHGCKEEFDKMLEFINFTDEDKMWILGDATDRGHDSIGVLKEIMQYKNMHLLMGDHEAWLKKYIPLMKGVTSAAYLTNYNRSLDLSIWLYSNGGIGTATQFCKLTLKEQEEIEDYLHKCEYYKKLVVNDKKYILVHAGVGTKKSYKPVDKTDHEVLTWYRPEIGDNPYGKNGVTLIVGHTPTFIYDRPTKKIINDKKDKWIDIDCGCVFGYYLGCMKLDDESTYYIKSEVESD